MPRAATTLDPFNAIAEPRRRDVLAALAKQPNGEAPVNDLVNLLQWPQPQVSKHLAVLREVGLVAVTRRGRQRVYTINADGLKTIHDWTAMYDKFRSHSLDRIKQHAEAKARAAEAPTHPLLNLIPLPPTTNPQEP